MRLALMCGLLVLTGCKDKPALSVEENTNLVKVEPDLEVVFGDPPKDQRPPAPVAIPTEEFPPKTLLVVTPTLSLEPSGMTTANALREVKVGLVIDGADPTDLVVEFTAPEGNVYNRQEQQLTQTRFHRQTAEFTMPVSGTSITAAQLYGTWHANVFLAGEKVSTLPFEVQP